MWRIKKLTELGSPPHMRGKGKAATMFHGQFGITPAHAGKRLGSLLRCGNKWDHPRTCGEKTPEQKEQAKAAGSPPHMRGKASESC